MVQIIQENRKPSFRSQLMGGFGQAARDASTQIPQMLMGRRENETLRKLIGKDVSGLSPELKKVVLEKHFSAQGAKQAEKNQSFQRAIDTVGRMRELISSAGPSNFVQGLFGVSQEI